MFASLCRNDACEQWRGKPVRAEAEAEAGRRGSLRLLAGDLDGNDERCLALLLAGTATAARERRLVRSTEFRDGDEAETEAEAENPALARMREGSMASDGSGVNSQPKLWTNPTPACNSTPPMTAPTGRGGGSVRLVVQLRDGAAAADPNGNQINVGH
jgi:hypothetical protein